MTFWRMWLRQPMRQPNWWGVGKERWDTERPLRLAGEAVIGRLATLPPRCLTRSSRRRLRSLAGGQGHEDRRRARLPSNRL